MKAAMVSQGSDFPEAITSVLGADRVDRCHYFGAPPVVSRHVDAFQIATVDPFPADLLWPRADAGNDRWHGTDADWWRQSCKTPNRSDRKTFRFPPLDIRPDPNVSNIRLGVGG